MKTKEYYKIGLPRTGGKFAFPVGGQIVIGFDEWTKNEVIIKYRYDSNRFFTFPYDGSLYPLDRVNKWRRIETKVYSMQKSSWSKPVDEDYTIFHLCSEDDPSIFCGIDKRFPGVYNQGFEPLSLDYLDSQITHLCKNCLKSLIKKLC